MYKNSPSLKLSLKLSATALLAVGSFLVFGLFHPLNSHAATGINQQLNFQGRLLDNTGAVVADGSYNMEFKVYQDGNGCVTGGSAPCSGTLKWTEDWIQTNRVTVKNGYFSVNLGSLTAFGANIDWNQDTLWLSTNIGGTTNTPTPTWDGEMTPFKRMAASPYSLNSNALQGLQAANFVQLAQGIQADTSTTNPSIFINKNNSSGTPNILELQKGGSDVMVVDNGGGLSVTPTNAAAAISLGATGQTGTITLGQYNGASTSIINIGANAGASSTQQINIGTSTLGISTVALGSGSSSSTTTINGGTGGINLLPNGTSNTGVVIKPTNNSTAALQIQTASAADTMFTADTTNNKLVVGNATGTNSATTQFIVDSSTADPSSGYNGSIYYNTTSNKFRCYQGSAWADCLGATQNSTLSIVSGLANVAASSTGTAVESLVFTSATAVSNVAGATGFKAAAGGSFRTCLVKNNAAITAGTLGVRWRVNGVSVGSAACNMDTTNSRSSSTALDAGVVTFSAGDTIGIAFDTSAGFLPTGTDDFTVFWTIEYNSTLTNAGATLQSAYNNSPTLTTTDTHDLVINAADTATDANLLFNLQCVTSCGANGRFAVQNGGTDVFTVSPNSGNITLAPAGTGSVVVTSDGNSNFQDNYISSTDDTLDIAHINILDNASASTGSLYGLAVVNNDNGANTGVPDALSYLKNANAAETVPDGLLVEQTGAGTLTNGIEVKQSAGTITSGLTFTGSFGSILKVGGTTVINSAGQIPTAQLTGSIPFSSISGATNTGALVIGTGGSLTTSGTGTITATDVGCTSCISLGTESTGNYVASVTNGTGISGGNGGSNGAALTLGIDQTAGLTWTGAETFSPSGANNLVVNGDNDSGLQINSTFSGTGPSQSAAAITLTDNASAAGTSYGLSVTNADNGANVGVPAALAYLKNANAAETVADGLLVEQTGAGTITNGLEVKQTAGTVSNGLTFTGTFGTNLINAGSALTVTAGGAGTFGGNLTVNGTTVSLGNGGATVISTPSGGASISIQPNGAGALNLATTSTGAVNIGNSTGAFQLTSSGGLNVSTGGALTGVASIDTITASATGLTFANAGTVASSGSNGLTLQAGNGTVSLGSSTVLTSSGASLTLSSNGGSDVALNSNLVLRPGTDSSSGVVIQNSAGVNNLATFGTDTSNPNLVANPSLEANANGWTKKGNVGVAATSSDDFAQYGTRSLKIVTTATIGDGASYSVPLKASTQYTLSAWIKVSTGTATTINLNRQDNGADVDAGTGNCTAISVTTTFTQFACTFTTGATVNGTTNVYVKQTDAPVGGRTIYVDGVTLVAAASGLTYDAGGSGLNLQTINSGLTLNGTDSGDVQPWQVSSTPLTTALRYGDGAQANGFAYYVGGCTGACGAGTQVATVYYSKMNADGSLGAWSAATSIPAGRYGLTTYVSNGYLYAVGGDSGAGAFGATPQTSVYYSKLNNDGTVGTWQTSLNVLPAAREFQTSTNMNGFAYVIGGDNAGAQSTAYYAKMYADGSTSLWTATTPLTTGAAARRDATTVTANGYIYVIGGDTGGTAQNTVYYNSINGDGTLGASWAATTAISVGGTQNRRYLTSVVANGYVYAIGGDNGTTAQSTVYYAKLLPDGTIGAWQAASNPLPAGRYGADSVIVNGYIYEIGGYDGTSAQATPYYASTARILIGGSLDLVGLGGGTISASAGAGSITAGNIRAVGGLTVDGAGDFNNGISVDSVINLNAVSANTGQTLFNINNLNSNSIFSIRHMSTNFGSLATAGAFVQKNSYWAEEYNVGHITNCSTSALASAGLVASFARGDTGGNASTGTGCTSAAATIGAGELNVATVIGNAVIADNQCTESSQNAANGIERITAAIATAASGDKADCVENLGSNVAGTSNKIYTTTNLPVITAKVKVSAMTVNATNSVVAIGANIRDNPNTDGAGVNLPNTGVFFTNCSTYTAGAPSGCSNTTWYGMVTSGGSSVAGSPVTCSVGSGSLTANFSYLRIEVRGTSDIHFYADYNTADGINESECGTGTTGASSTTAMTPWIEVKAIGNNVLTNSLDVDYIRSWQDDNVAPAADVSPTAPDAQAALSTPPLTTDFVNVADSSSGSSSPADAAAPSSDPFFDFAAATSDDTVFNNNVYVHGTLFADKIVANQVEGMDVITDQIKSLSDELAKQQAATPATTKTGLSGAGSGNGKVSFTTVSAVNLTVLAQIETKGGLIVDGDAQFNGKTLFQLAAEFAGPANFDGQVTYNSDAGGNAIIKNGDQKVSIKFSKEYTAKPIIIANWLLNDTKDSQGNVDTSDEKQQRLLDGGYSYSVANVTTKGFDIILNKKASEDVELSWIANAIKNAQISQSSSGSSL